MELKKIIAGHLLVLVLVFPHAVSAEDFTFNMQVNVSNLHSDIDQMRVHCEVEGIVLDKEFILINVPANGGANNSTVQIKANAANKNDLNPRPDPIQRAFACALQVSKPGAGFKEFLPSDGRGCGGAEEWRCARQGTPFAARLDGFLDLFKK
jgi:hypothetical protein